MRFSIIIPVHNNPVDLAACLESIGRLTFDKTLYEVIVVDNNSTDDTRTVAQSFGVTVLEETAFQSSYAARNRGIREARGEFVAFTDSDCVVDERWLDEIDAAAAGDDSMGCLAGEVLSLPPATLVERFSDRIGLLRQRGPLSGWHFKPYAHTANAVYRRKVFDEIGLFDPAVKSGGDAAIAWRMLDRTRYTLKFVPTAIVYHHHRASVEELWKQFRRHGNGKMSWAVAQPDYSPPGIAKLEAEAVVAFEKAVAALDTAGLDEKLLVFPVLEAVTQTAHLSGYLQDLLTRLSGGPLDVLPTRARELAPRCNICGSEMFIQGPNNRMVNGRAPQCVECGSLERHRVLASVLNRWPAGDLAARSIVSFGEALPPRLAQRFAAARAARLGDSVPGRHDMVVVPGFVALAQGRSLPETFGPLVEPLREDGVLVLLDRHDATCDLGANDSSSRFVIGKDLKTVTAAHLPYVVADGHNVQDTPTSVLYAVAICGSRAVLAHGPTTTSYSNGERHPYAAATA